MTNVPEPEKELKPIFRDARKQPGLPYSDKVPVPDLPESIAPKPTSMPDKEGLFWQGARHFLFGVIEFGGGALGAVAAVGALANPYAWPVIGVIALLGGGIGAGRKIKKIQAGGTDFTDKIYALIEIILDIFLAYWKNKKAGKK